MRWLHRAYSSVQRACGFTCTLLIVFAPDLPFQMQPARRVCPRVLTHVMRTMTDCAKQNAYEVAAKVHSID